MCGDVVTVRALAPPQIDPRYDFPDTLHVSLQFASHAIATLNVSMVYPLLKFREAGGPLVICKNGGMRFVPFMDHLDLHSQHRDDAEPRFERFDDLGFKHAYRQEFGDFIRCSITFSGLGSTIFAWVADHLWNPAATGFQSSHPFVTATVLGLVGSVGLLLFDLFVPIRQREGTRHASQVDLSSRSGH